MNPLHFFGLSANATVSVQKEKKNNLTISATTNRELATKAKVYDITTVEILQGIDERTKRTKRTNETNRTVIGARCSFCAFLEFPAEIRDRKPKKENEATKHPTGIPGRTGEK